MCAKVRSGFVSNSSSSSFICDITGDTEEGMDLSLSEAGMLQCEHGHVFYERFAKKGMDEILENIDPQLVLNHFEGYSSRKKDLLVIKAYIENPDDEELQDLYEELVDEYNGDTDLRGELPERYCPICQLEYIDNNTLAKLAIKKFDFFARKDLVTFLKKQYNDFATLEKALELDRINSNYK